MKKFLIFILLFFGTYLSSFASKDNYLYNYYSKTISSANYLIPMSMTYTFTGDVMIDKITCSYVNLSGYTGTVALAGYFGPGYNLGVPLFLDNQTKNLTVEPQMFFSSGSTFYNRVAVNNTFNVGDVIHVGCYFTYHYIFPEKNDYVKILKIDELKNIYISKDYHKFQDLFFYIIIVPIFGIYVFVRFLWLLYNLIFKN